MKNKCSVHTFILPPPNGHESPGVCKVCGTKKMFFNSTPAAYNPWQQTKKMTWKAKIELEQ